MGKQPDNTEPVSLRLRFWLFAMDVASFLRLPTPVYLWCVGKAGDATDWGEDLVSTGDGEKPF